MCSSAIHFLQRFSAYNIKGDPSKNRLHAAKVPFAGSSSNWLIKDVFGILGYSMQIVHLINERI
jgi:hypothetical protein